MCVGGGDGEREGVFVHPLLVELHSAYGTHKEGVHAHGNILPHVSSGTSSSLNLIHNEWHFILYRVRYMYTHSVNYMYIALIVPHRINAGGDNIATIAAARVSTLLGVLLVSAVTMSVMIVVLRKKQKKIYEPEK